MSEITAPFYLRSPNPMDDFNSLSAMIKLAIWILLPNLFMWAMGSDHIIEWFRRGVIHSVEILIRRDMLASSLEDFFSSVSENDDSVVSSDIPWSWMEKEDSNNNNGNKDDWDVFCADPPKEENRTASRRPVRGWRSARRRDAAEGAAIAEELATLANEAAAAARAAAAAASPAGAEAARFATSAAYFAAAAANAAAVAANYAVAALY